MQYYIKQQITLDGAVKVANDKLKRAKIDAGLELHEIDELWKNI